MKHGGEGWIIFAMLACFVGVAVLLVAKFGGSEETFVPGTSYSPKFDGTKALYELLGSSGFKVQRFGETEFSYPDGACMLIVQEVEIDSATLFSGGLDSSAVRLWLEKGGHMVVAASLDSVLLNTLSKEFGAIEPTPPPPADQVAAFKGTGGKGEAQALWRSYRPGMIYKLPARRPRIWRSVASFEAAEEIGTVPVGGHGLLYAGDPPLPMVLFRKQGQGEIYFLLRPEILVNGWIDRADNHRLVLALLSRAAEGRMIYFDEHVHGYRREGYNAGSLVTGTTGGRLLLALGASVALLFLGAAIKPARSAPPPVPARRQAAEMVLAQASLYRRAGVRQIVAENLVDGVKRAYMLANHLAALPTNEELLGWLMSGNDPGRPGQGGSALTVYLETQAPFRSAIELLRLAQACDRARRRL